MINLDVYSGHGGNAHGHGGAAVSHESKKDATVGLVVTKVRKKLWQTIVVMIG